MSDKDRLMRLLFDNPNRIHRNIHITRGSNPNLTADDLYRETADSLEQVERGDIQPEASFHENYPKTHISQL